MTQLLPFGQKALISAHMDLEYRTGSVLRHPAILVVSSFGLVILVGAALLLLPWMHKMPLGPIDALFTATSAVCVTGLVVVDTATHFSRLGQLVLMALMEIGGLGVMTFSILFAIALKRHLGLSSRFIVQEGFLAVKAPGIPKVVRMIVVYAVGVEVLSAVLLFFFFYKDMPLDDAAFHALFHSVSAFCNAGFSTFQDGLVRYEFHWGVCLVVMGAILLGNSGFSIFYEIKERVLRRTSQRQFSLHLKLTLAMHFSLIFLGTIGILLTEAHGVLRGLSPLNRVLVASFHSVSARTAGFNTVSMSSFTEDTLYLLVVLMFIGACPGSTGGGIKTTTISILLAAAMSRLRGFTKTTVFNRTVPDEAVQKATVLFVLSIIVIFYAHMMLMFAGPNLPFRSSHSEFLAYLFETVSGLGTVGLSVGVTQKLTGFGKVVMIAIMFIGRVGLLSIISVLTMAGRRPRPYHFPSENVMVG